MGMFSFVSNVFHAVSNVVSSVASVVSNTVSNAVSGVSKVVSGIGKTIESVGRSLGTTVNAIIKNPLPVIAAVALTVATSGTGAFAAEFILGADAIGAAAAGNAAAFSAISAAVPAAISSAAVTALQGGSVSQIATAGILAGVGAGMTAGLSATQAIQAITSDLSPAMAQTISAATGRGLGQAVSAVLSGKDPLTGFASGAVTGALSSAFTNGQIAELNKAAANILGSTAGAATGAGISGGNVDNAIAGALVTGSLKTTLGAAYSGFVDAKNALAEKVNAFYKEQTETLDFQNKIVKERETVDSLYNQLQAQVTAYNSAKANNDVDGMTAAATKFDALKPQYDTAVATAVDDSYKFNAQVKELEAVKASAMAQNDQFVQGQKNLETTYADVITKSTDPNNPQNVIDRRLAALDERAQDAYDAAIAKGQTPTNAFAEAEKVQNDLGADAKAPQAPLYSGSSVTVSAPPPEKTDEELLPTTSKTDEELLPTTTSKTDEELLPTTSKTADELYQMALDSGYSEDEAKQYAYGNSSEYDTTITGVGSSGEKTDTGIDYTNINVSVPTTGQPVTTGPSTPTTPPPTTTTSAGTGTGTGVNVKLPITTGSTNTTTPTLPITPAASGSTAAASKPKITDLTPQLTKATSFKFANQPEFSDQTHFMSNPTPFDYTSQILNAATGGAIADLKPQLTEKRQFQFASNPTYQSQTQPVTQTNTPFDYTQQILNAAAGGSVFGYASGSSVGKVEGVEVLSPQLTRGRPVGSMFQSYRPHFANGGDVQEHNPQFFSVGGLNSLENTYVKGEGDGTSDQVPAMLANGEFVIPADVVSKLGNGSNDAGANVLDEFLATIRQHAQNHDPKKLPPSSKGPLAYLLDAKRKVG